ncbi:TPA: hypothetical protein ACH3X1_013325 [Trebouxia sp. C0004]
MLQQLIGDLIRTWRLVVAQTACPYAGSSCGILPQCHLSTKASWSAGKPLRACLFTSLLFPPFGSQCGESACAVCVSSLFLQMHLPIGLRGASSMLYSAEMHLPVGLRGASSMLHSPEMRLPVSLRGASSILHSLEMTVSTHSLL